MVKKTLLSLAIAASAAGMAGCNISSVEKHNNDVDLEAVDAGKPGSTPARVAPVFSAANQQLPLAIDIVFAINQAPDGTPGKDGTADVADSQPPVTTALNKLDGFSTVAPIYIEFNSALDPDSVQSGKTVLLAKLSNAVDDPTIDPLDNATILASSAGIFSPDPILPTSYEARYATLDDGRTPVIQILLKEPLDPKTKYMVVVTNGVKSASGENIGPSAEFELLASDLQLPSPALSPVRDAVQGWQQLAAGYLGSPFSPGSEGESVLSYTFTTTGTQDVLHAMAAPGTFLTSQIPNIAAAEATISAGVIAAALEGGADQATAEAMAQGTLLQVAQGTAVAINTAAGTAVVPVDDTTRDVLLASETLSPKYYAGLITTIADGQGQGLDAAVDKPKSREFKALMADPSNPVEVPYSDFLTAALTPKVTAAVESQIADIATGEGAITQAVIAGGGDQAAANAQLDVIANAVATNLNAANAENDEWTDLPTSGDTVRPMLKASDALKPFYLAGLRQAIVSSQVPTQVAALTSGGSLFQGGLKVPSYLPEAEAGKGDADLGSWSASNSAAQALGLAGAPVDVNGTANVTYRFPFADKLGDNVVPVLVTTPPESCDPDGAGPAPAMNKPADGWPVVIYQHGITVDRTAGVLVGNALAKGCMAMVAIDHAMHGIGPESSTGLTFNVNTLHENPTATTSPFALARVAAEGAGDTFFASLKERHNNVGKNALLQNVDMAFEGAGAQANVGASGDLYINLQDFARTRDGMRQTVIDLMNLNASIGDMDVNADGSSDDLDPANVFFIGHSLGGIIGTTFLAVNNDPNVQAFNTNLPEIKGAVLGNPGGGVTKLLENSPGIGASKILPGLKNANAELVQGSSTIEKFMGILQATVDSADPINFASAEHMQSLPMVTYTAVGDKVVPNNTLAPYQYRLNEQNEVEVVLEGGLPKAAPDSSKSYLSGTDPLVSALGITEVINGSTAVGPVAGSKLSVRLDDAKSSHGTFSSADPQETFTEIFTQVGSFFGMGLNGIQVTDTSVLEQAE